MAHEKVYSIAKHEGILKGIKIKDLNENIYFDSHWTAGVDYQCENKVSSEENGEDNEEDSDHEPESDSDDESKESNAENDDVDYSHPDIQEALDDSESGSNDA